MLEVMSGQIRGNITLIHVARYSIVLGMRLKTLPFFIDGNGKCEALQ